MGTVHRNAILCSCGKVRVEFVAPAMWRDRCPCHDCHGLLRMLHEERRRFQTDRNDSCPAGPPDCRNLGDEAEWIHFHDEFQLLVNVEGDNAALPLTLPGLLDGSEVVRNGTTYRIMAT